MEGCIKVNTYTNIRGGASPASNQPQVKEKGQETNQKVYNAIHKTTASILK